ncbi:hypothetical protein DPMN_103202 [Dreissena polymorpha]|uniref:Reverse transcriptase n=1 Tax=Dreissena polymorpha TaxID=45954 RepID=A0A9D4K0K5_DREPO|nr:hypothetical protein DPMN_103202 [Dreissena polymorpha]
MVDHCGRDLQLQSHRWKYLQHQRELFNNFIDFKKAFDCTWHNGLRLVLSDCNVGTRPVQIIQETPAVQ